MTGALDNVDDVCESYDGDLGWILEKLAHRAGASFGLIVRFVDGIEAPAMMARTPNADGFAEATIRQLTDELRRALASRPMARRELATSDGIRLGSDHQAPVRLLYMTFQPTPGVTIVAAVGRPESSSAMLQSLIARRLYPVLERYVRLWWMHRTERRRASALESALEAAELGVTLLDRRGQILYENKYARRVLDTADGVRRIGRTLTSSEGEDAVRLQTAIHHALAGNLAADRNTLWQAPLVKIRRGESKRALLLTVMAHRGRAVDADDAAAIIYIVHPECELRESLLPVCRIYGLTPAEARIVAGLVRGASLQEVAVDMNVSLATTRAQLKHVFAKTRTNRQAELVGVMLASAARSSVAPDFTLM